MATSPPRQQILTRTVISMEILHEGMFALDTLAEIGEAITTGSMSGGELKVSSEEVSRERMIELLHAQGSDPAFLIRDYEEPQEEDEPSEPTSTAGSPIHDTEPATTSAQTPAAPSALSSGTARTRAKSARSASKPSRNAGAGKPSRHTKTERKR